MPTSFAILIGCQLAGEVLHRALHLPLPGAVIGMVLLALALVVAGDDRPTGAAQLDRTANLLIANMGLLFVPAGVGIIAERDVLRHNWLPILGGLVVSTVLGLAVTGLVMHRISRAVEQGHRTPALPAILR
jgi:holin-like protein